VDATEVGGDLALRAEKLAGQRKATVVITGKVDIATDGKRTYLVENGHPMMTRVVGTGCMATSVIGAFAAVERDLSLAAACALACYGIAAEVAAEKASGPASFKEHLFDCLYHLDRQTVDSRQSIDTPQRSPEGG
jgi:hydroxyethylthiazole kinase